MWPRTLSEWLVLNYMFFSYPQPYLVMCMYRCMYGQCNKLHKQSDVQHCMLSLLDHGFMLMTIIDNYLHVIGASLSEPNCIAEVCVYAFCLDRPLTVNFWEQRLFIDKLNALAARTATCFLNHGTSLTIAWRASCDSRTAGCTLASGTCLAWPLIHSMNSPASSCFDCEA